MSVIEITESLVIPIIEKFNLILWDIEFKKEGSGFVLRVYIAKPEGVSIEDCENVAKELNPALDAADPIEQSYSLEISSAGLIRELKKDSHILQFIGEEITLKLYKPINNSKTFTGQLISYENQNLLIETENKQMIFKRSDIAKIIIDLI